MLKKIICPPDKSDLNKLLDIWREELRVARERLEEVEEERNKLINRIEEIEHAMTDLSLSMNRRKC